MIKNTWICFSLCIAFSIASFGQGKNFYIVFIGNSITHGAGLKNPETTAPPVYAIKWLQSQHRYGELNFSNQGVSGATTVDFLPATNKYFPRVVQGADLYKNQQDATLIFSMILGTNDSAISGPNGSPVSPDSYEKNVRTIIDSLFTRYPESIVILHRPIWYSPNTYNRSKYMEEGLERLQTYFPVLDGIIAGYKKSNPNHVFAGDKSAFKYFKKHKNLFQQEKGNAGIFLLHPNEAGAEVLGTYWAKAINKNLTNYKLL